MAEDRYRLQLPGQEIQQGDIDVFAGAAALADDRVLSEALRLVPFAGTVAKAILPYSPKGYFSATSKAQGTVSKSGAADGKVIVNPFRAIIGTLDTIANIGADKNWRDIRSAVYDVSDDATTQGHAISFAANASGSPRWDLIYVAFTPDVPSNSVTRKVKVPAGTTVTPTSVNQVLRQVLSILVVQGTPGALPTAPALPADAAGTYYIPLAYVIIINGYGAGSLIKNKEIMDSSPIPALSHSFGGASPVAVANQSFLVGGAVHQNNAAHMGAYAQVDEVNTRGFFMPPNMAGGKQLLVPIDVSDASSANWSHASGAVVDDSVDWRRRVFRWSVYGVNRVAQANAQLAWGASAPQSYCVPWGADAPVGAAAANSQTFSLGQSFQDDSPTTGTGVASGAVAYIPAARTNMLNAGAVCLYVDYADGKLKLFVLGAPRSVLFFWIDCSGQFQGWPG